MSTDTNTADLADTVRAHLDAMDPGQLAAALTATTSEARVVAMHRDLPMVPIADEDRAYVVEALESEVEAVDRLFCLHGEDGELDPFAAFEHLNRHLPLLAHARQGRVLVSEDAAAVIGGFAESWREVDGFEDEPELLRRIAAQERVAASVTAALSATSPTRDDEHEMAAPRGERCDACGRLVPVFEDDLGAVCEGCRAYELGRDHGRAAALEDAVVTLSFMAHGEPDTTEATITKAATDGFNSNTGDLPVLGEGPAGRPRPGEPRPWLLATTPAAPRNHPGSLLLARAEQEELIPRAALHLTGECQEVGFGEDPAPALRGAFEIEEVAVFLTAVIGGALPTTQGSVSVISDITRDVRETLAIAEREGHEDDIAAARTSHKLLYDLQTRLGAAIREARA